MRYNLINPQLKKAEWNRSNRTQVAFEIPVAGYDASVSEGYTDYYMHNTYSNIYPIIKHTCIYYINRALRMILII